MRSDWLTQIARNNSTVDTTGYAYDGFDRLSTTSYPNGGSGATSEGFTYDADGNVKTRTTRKGDVIAFGYDSLNRLCTKTYAATAVACGGTSTKYLVNYAYDLAGRVVAANDNGATVAALAGSNSFAQSATYDALNRPINLSWSPVAAQTVPASSSSVTFSHGYDANNRRISQAANDNSWLAYPAAASSTAYTTNALNQYTAIGAVSPTYDANGNLTSDGTFTYGYDVENRLTSASGAGNTVAYAYDAQGRRKSKTVNGTTTAYVTDADNRELLEYAAATGQTQAWYAYGLGPNDVLDRMNPTGNSRQTLIPDIQGSFIGTLDSSGTLTKRGYRPYGESATTTGSFAYTGQRIDPETNGLYYYRARTYSPTVGRFLQADPARYLGGDNLYSYVGGDPLNSSDPNGLDTLQIGYAGGGAIRGIFNIQGGFGFVIDSLGQIGFYAFSGVGPTTGAGTVAQLNYGLSVQGSDAKTIYDLSGPFVNPSVTMGRRVGGSLDYFTGSSPNGPVVGGGFTIGPAIGASASVLTTGTMICGFQGCVGSPLPLVDFFSSPSDDAMPTSPRSTKGDGGKS